MTKIRAPSIKNRVGSEIVAGFSAARDTRRGTPFVRAIHDVFRAHAKSDDILSLLTRVRTINVFLSEGDWYKAMGDSPGYFPWRRIIFSQFLRFICTKCFKAAIVANFGIIGLK